jgi:ribonucleoside-triphosphate reductase (thioredoxin)
MTSVKQIRLRQFAENRLADFIFHSRYARFDARNGRWESFSEAIERVAEMHRHRFSSLLDEQIPRESEIRSAQVADRQLLSNLLAGRTLGELIDRAFAAASRREVLPSLRSLQYGGSAGLAQNARLFNCGYSPADRVSFFREYAYLLMLGVGCGFSVQRAHVARLPHFPKLTNAAPVQRFLGQALEDYIAAVDFVFQSHLRGRRVAFEFDADAESPGLPAPRHFASSLHKITNVLASAAGRQLLPVEVYQCCLYLAEAADSDDRRSATLCLFSPDDTALRAAKTGDWMRRHPERRLANNSVALIRTAVKRDDIARVLLAQREFGEPGIYFTDSEDFGCNPCGEAGLEATLATSEHTTFNSANGRGANGSRSKAERESGWQLCNLSTINGAACRSIEGFFSAAVHAAIIGTLQAAYTDIPELGPVSRILNDRDALLGVSICGFADNPHLLFVPQVLERAAHLVRTTNRYVSALIGINPAVRCTCVKPEGSASLLLRCGAGIHPYPDQYFFRRVRVRTASAAAMAFAEANPEMVEHDANGEMKYILFPVTAPRGALLSRDGTAVEFLERVRLVQRYWVDAGDARAGRSPRARHGVSYTCPVEAEEWDAVIDYLWNHRGELAGATCFSRAAAAHYPDVPVAPVANGDAIRRWNAFECRRVRHNALPQEVEPVPSFAC